MGIDCAGCIGFRVVGSMPCLAQEIGYQADGVPLVSTQPARRVSITTACSAGEHADETCETTFPLLSLRMLFNVGT